jgi:hypothetical protein
MFFSPYTPTIFTVVIHNHLLSGLIQSMADPSSSVIPLATRATALRLLWLDALNHLRMRSWSQKPTER